MPLVERAAHYIISAKYYAYLTTKERYRAKSTLTLQQITLHFHQITLTLSQIKLAMRDVSSHLAIVSLRNSVIALIYDIFNFSDEIRPKTQKFFFFL
ncbi:MAG: hypothetical protein FVQ82_03170 [Planctomycetes bacterium]|nr:hypothetical protein [Planctomycetota bacterium]